MKALISIGPAAGLALALSMGTTSALGTPILEFSGGETNPAGVDSSFGWSFTTNQAITVTALDAFDPTGDGTAGAVRLYNAGGTVLASAMVTTSDPQEGSPILFYSAAISPVLLAANTKYYIIEDSGSSTIVYNRVGSLTTGPDITYDGALSERGQGQNPTTDLFGGALNPAFFGPNFDIASASVPEPGTLALFGAGLAALFLLRRRTKTLAS